MERYIRTKVIEARPMTRGDYNTLRGWTIPADENPLDEGYLVKYEDGYISWSPQDVFEHSYRRSGYLDFGAVIEMLKRGYRLARKGWNGKGMYIYLVAGTLIPAQNLRNEALRHVGLEIGRDEEVLINSHIDMKAADGTIVVGWLASQTDMLAEDWEIVQ